MTRCEMGVQHQAESELEAVMAQLNQKISPDGKAQLKRAHDSWKKYRDAQCAFDTMGSAGGSIHAAVLAMCHQTTTQRQIAVLREQLQCEEGDLSCGGQ